MDNAEAEAKAEELHGHLHQVWCPDLTREVPRVTTTEELSPIPLWRSGCA